ncbi:hypothetical protein [Candidatus Poriferisocius sp.]|uniref:hypothetical protein n=1 Tax=Candidatus Poriferisocius sp. TaxID=3101276 RepID=UPI003B01D6A4
MGVSDTPADLTPLIGILDRGDRPTDVARDEQEMIDEAFGQEFDRKLRDRGVVE